MPFDMKFLFEISKEHNTIPSSEVFSTIESEGFKYEKIETNPDLIIVDFLENKRKIYEISKRLAYTYYVDEFLFSTQTNIDEVKKKSEKNQIDEKGSIAVRYKNRSKKISSNKIVKILAETYSKNRKVSLENPDIEIRCIITDSKVYVGKKIIKNNRSNYESRKVQNRPFFSPISLHPKIARALVNISKIKKNQILYDPFCGTGGILLEAGLIGAKIIGSDIEEKMVEGCKKTLMHYNIKDCTIFCSDIGNIKDHINKVDAVVTDMPYGKSTTTKGEDILELYARAFRNIADILKPDGVAVIGVSNKKAIDLGKRYLDLVDLHEIRAHRSLTRYFPVYQKLP